MSDALAIVEIVGLVGAGVATVAAAIVSGGKAGAKKYAGREGEDDAKVEKNTADIAGHGKRLTAAELLLQQHDDKGRGVELQIETERKLADETRARLQRIDARTDKMQDALGKMAVGVSRLQVLVEDTSPGFPRDKTEEKT